MQLDSRHDNPKTSLEDCQSLANSSQLVLAAQQYSGRKERKGAKKQNQRSGKLMLGEVRYTAKRILLQQRLFDDYPVERFAL
jgi:hypothetical protein